MTRAFAAMRTPLRRRLGLLTVTLGLILALPAQSAAAASADAWASPTGGGGNTMTNPGETTIAPGNAAKLVRAWTLSDANFSSVAPTVVGGVVYYLHRHNSVTDSDALVAASTRTGKTLWRVALTSTGFQYFWDGVTVSGPMALMTFQTVSGGGLLAVDTRTHKVAWRTVTDSDAGIGGSPPHYVYADGLRAYVNVAYMKLAAYRLSDGKLQWTAPLDSNEGIGIALGNGVLYLGYARTTEGITAYDTATGRKLWTAPGLGTPVLAGSRVFSVLYSTVVAVNAAGCGRSACPALWKRTFPVAYPTQLTLGAGDASTLFLTYQKVVPPDQNGYTWAGVIARLSAATGVQQWTATVGGYLSPPVRGGNIVWAASQQGTAAGTIVGSLVGFAATSNATTPRAKVPAAQAGTPQNLAVGGGTLFEQTNIYPGLVGYRVPGT